MANFGLSLRSEAYPLLITVLTQLAAIVFVYQLIPVVGTVTFQPVIGAGAPLWNALIFLSLPIAGTLVFLRVRKRRRIKEMYAIFESLLVILLTYLVLGLSGLSLVVSAVAALTVGVFGYFIVLRKGELAKIVYAVLLSSEAGAFLATIFSVPTVYFVFLLFALYDIFAVFRGPLKSVVEDPGFGMLSVDVGKVSMGLGDQIFYSMVPATALLAKGLTASLLLLPLEDVGIVATLLLLRRRRALPGLTIPLLLSIGFLLLFP